MLSVHCLSRESRNRRICISTFLSVPLAVIFLWDSVDESFLKKIVFLDEAIFHVCGELHKHNVWIWGTEKPYEFREHIRRDSPKLNVWSIISYERLIGMILNHEQTNNGKICLDMLEDCFSTAIRPSA